MLAVAGFRSILASVAFRSRGSPERVGNLSDALGCSSDRVAGLEPE